MNLRTLGDLLGPLHYFGACAKCRRQFMSTHDRVYVDPRDGYSHVHYCDRCPPSGERKESE